MRPDDLPALPNLNALLDWNLRFSPDYDRGMSSHLPMGLQALQALGADGARLREWALAESRPLAPRDAPTTPVEIEFARFSAALARDGRDAALRTALPWLMPGVAAVAFHGLIRTAHALRAGHDGELALGLAHWASHHQRLPDAEPYDPLPLGDWLAALAALPATPDPAGRLISERIARCGARADFAALAPRLNIEADSLFALARLSAATYAASGSFTVLHMVTASWAMLVLEPWWPGPALPRSFSVAAAAALLSTGLRPVLEVEAEAVDWPTLASQACRQNDAHVIKLVHAARELQRRWPAEPAFAAAGQRAIRAMRPAARRP